MKLISLNCNQCSAPLEVPVRARFVTCSFCDTRLSIQRTGSTYSTSVLQEIRETTQALARDVAEIKTAAEIEQLDREWAMEKDQLLVQRKDGRASVPTKGGAIGAGLGASAFGLFWTVMAGGIVSGGQRIGAPGFLFCFPLFGVLFIAAAVCSAVSMWNKADKFERAQKRYQRRRRDLGDRG